MMADSNNLNAGMRVIKFIIFIISFMFGVSILKLIKNTFYESTKKRDFNEILISNLSFITKKKLKKKRMRKFFRQFFLIFSLSSGNFYAAISLLSTKIFLTLIYHAQTWLCVCVSVRMSHSSTIIEKNSHPFFSHSLTFSRKKIFISQY